MTDKQLPKPNSGPSLPDTRQELEGPSSEFHSSTSAVHQQGEALVEEIMELAMRQNNWFERLSIPEHQKRQLQLYREKQEAALEVILNARNHSLKAVGEARVAFIREACNSLLLVGRSGVQSAVKSIFTENALHLQRQLEKLNCEFWDIVAEKLEDAANRPERLRPVIQQQVTLMVEKWNQHYEQILEEFGGLLSEKV